MKDNFDLKKFLKENKTMENANPYLAESGEEEEVQETDNHTRESLTNMVKELALKELGIDQGEVSEKKEDDEAEVDAEIDAEVDAELEDAPEEPVEDAPEGDGVMNHLEAAMAAAKREGAEEKVIDQIGNTITMITRMNVNAAE